MSKVLCIYHANCADGLGAAWAVHKALGDQVEFVSAEYGDQPQLSEPCKYHSTTEPCTDCLGTGYELGGGPFLNHDVLIVDFSYPLPVLRAMAAEARSVLVIGRHETAQEDLSSIAPPSDGRRRITDLAGWFAYWNTDRDTPNLAAIFDMNRSGAGLTWDYLCSKPEGCPTNVIVPRPRIIDLIEDRDLRRFKYGDETRAFHAVLTSYGFDDLPAAFERLDEWNHWFEHSDLGFKSSWPECQTAKDNLIETGRAILRSRDALVHSVVTTTRRTMPIAGYVVPVANVPHELASDAGHLLCEPKLNVDYDPVVQTLRDGIPVVVPPFAATYYDGADGRRHFSLRSPEGGADVGEIARGMAAHLNWLVTERFTDFKYEWKGVFIGGGHEHAAGFDAPIGWEGE